jgi:hypothetical protein
MSRPTYSQTRWLEDLFEMPEKQEAAMNYFDRVKNCFCEFEERIGQDKGFQPYWPTCVIEHCHIWPILESIQSDGLAVQA